MLKNTELTSDSGMSFNVNKFFYATFGKSDIPWHYTICGSNYVSNSLFKDLAVTVTTGTPLSFNTHMVKITEKAS